MKPVNDFTATILIVDDLAENIEVLGTVLRRNKYKVAVAMNGEEAISVSRSIIPDLILLDISMPGMDGFSVCKVLKDDLLTAEIPIIFLTAKAESDDVVTGLSLGAVDYITKPFKSPELLMRLKTHLTIKNLRDELKLANESLEKKVEERTQELKTALEKVEQSDKLKSEFLSQISHEIRTPLNAVISSASLIEVEMEDKIDEFLIPIFKSLKKGSGRIIRTVDLLLNMAQLHTNSYPIKIEKIDLSDILLLVSSKYRNFAREKNLSLEFKCPLNEAYISGDYHAVSETFEQLLDNAVNYTNQGKIVIEMYESGDKYTVVVTDTGVGISDEYLPKLFEFFSQEDVGYTRKFEGNGLGLAVTKKYCEINKAAISVESQKNTGSKFFVSFNKHNGV